MQQQGARQLPNLFHFDQETKTIVPVYVHPQVPFGMQLQSSTGTGSNSQSVSPLPINNPPQLPMAVVFENVKKQWEQHPTSRFQLDGVDLYHFLFNPEGYKVIPQPVRKVKTSLDLWRIHRWRPRTPVEHYNEPWSRLSDKERMTWSVKLKDLKMQQARQEKKGWIELHLSKPWQRAKDRQEVLL